MTQVIKLQFHDQANCIFVDKISGLNTHTPSFGQRGCVEIFEHELDIKLFPAHRLDKATSGALVFAKSSETAAKLTQLFESHSVQKKYLFLTDKISNLTEFTYESNITKEKNIFVSRKSEVNNSKTTFKYLKKLGAYYLWEATPHSGKPHQIRLHAQDNNISILGDNEHGGSHFFRLCLHSLSLAFELDGEKIHFETEAPYWSRFSVLDLEELIIHEAIQRRERLYAISKFPEECLRLAHRELDTYRIDQYGHTLWVYWYKESDPTPTDMDRFTRISKAYNKNILIRKMLNRGEDPNAELLWEIGQPEARWIAKENGVSFDLRSDTGLSPGLFLDQRENRLWVKDHAKDKSVLNLFSYTSGFSLVSALGGAREVCTVDVSANFIEWSKENFKLNNLDPEAEKYEFWVQDCLLFLKGTYRRKRKFGLIICDPPSFGRSKSGVFSISKNFDELIINCLYCLEKNGLLLFSTNYEKWETSDLHAKLNKLKKEFSFKVLDAPPQGLDFELPDQSPLMKSIIVRKS